ncbi:hypothetical protein L21_1295 [Methanoculleus chikugoensis]|jgi:hypothetical protein|uniref:Uncharacterized protein n=1 Tax=Methanoculleus chikugoensis TaxID=118126 RepID=A0A1M4MKK1_9EURY|nr:hypothetical protein [Methanoculleus chikugoensis]NMA09624.1 hypothetical protein [Methanomicrobiales archaeon]SCL75396.1 hypothetical protein L21_1295 [Methanoculleus chikugoensis]
MPERPQAKNNQRYGKMARYFGYSPKGTAKSAVESFESTTQVRSAGGTLLGTVYVDISDEEWAVAIAYGRTQHPKLRGPEPIYEVRYAHRTGETGETERIDTREEGACAITVDPFPSVDDFIVWALGEEKGRITGTVV